MWLNNNPIYKLSKSILLRKNPEKYFASQTFGRWENSYKFKIDRNLLFVRRLFNIYNFNQPFLCRQTECGNHFNETCLETETYVRPQHTATQP